MRKRMMAFLAGVLCLGLGTASAHALWIETATQGKKGVSQDVKVYFGEFGTEDISPATEWFSDLKDFELLLITPDNKQIKLPVKAAGNAYSASFVPEMDGTYQLAIRKTAGEVYYGYKLDYNASATIQVGAAKTDLKPSNPLAILPVSGEGQVNKVIRLQAAADATWKGEQKLTVISPNTWTKRLYPGQDHQAAFTPLWPGKYLVELTIEDDTAGTHNGKAYKVDYHCATFVYEVQ